MAGLSDHGWDPGARLECETCGATLYVAEDERTATCAYCASPSIVERPATPERPNPSLAIGFTVSRERALAAARAWVERALLAPRAFRQAAIDTMNGVYVPAYLYTAAAHSYYRAMIGEAYAEEEEYTTLGPGGRLTKKTQTVTHYEWLPLSGDHAVYINEHVVTASRGLEDRELQGVTPFDLRAVQRFTPELIAGWIAEEPSIDPHWARDMARTSARARLQKDITAFLPGDRRRVLDTGTHFHLEHLELALLPLWILPVRYDLERPAVRLLVNGQTGKVYGRAPLSAIKILVLALMAMFATVLLFWLFPPA